MTAPRQPVSPESPPRSIREAAHELNNLLTAIETYASLLTDAVVGNEQALQDVEQIRVATHRAAAVVRDLFSHDRPVDR